MVFFWLFIGVCRVALFFSFPDHGVGLLGTRAKHHFSKSGNRRVLVSHNFKELSV